MSELNKQTITNALEGLNNKDFSAVELTQAHIDAMAEHKSLNAFVTETPDLALEQAKASDERRAKGEKPGLLEGIPLAIKDLFCTNGVRTTASSKILENFVPPYESTVTQKLWDAGALMLGKVSLDQFGMGSANINSHFGPVINPWKRKGDDTNLVPGGSSGGSSAAVAAHMAMGATATDTGGSVRQPAAFCGLVGIKPSYGRCSRWGVISFASSLDTPSFMGRSVADASLLLQATSGHDSKDSTSAAREAHDLLSALKDQDVKGMKIGIPKEYNAPGMPEEITKVWEQGAAWLKDAGAQVIDISLPHTKYALATYYILAPAEASSNLARYDGVRYGHRADDYGDLIDMYEKTRAEGFGEEVKRRILIGTYVLSAGYYDAYYIKAQQVRRLIAQDFEKAFEQCDTILTPTAPSAAFAIGENQDDPIKMYLNDVFTVPASLAGMPAISVPAGLNDEGLPLGLQLISPRWREDTLVRTAQAIENAAGFKGL